MSDEFNFLDFLDTEEEAQNSGGGGGGAVGKFTVEYGYKLFVSGVSNEDSWFPYDASKGKSAREKALARAKDKLVQLGEQGENVTRADGKMKAPQGGVNFILHKSSVLNRDTDNWKGDLHYFSASWSDDYKKIVRPKLEAAAEESGVVIRNEVWGQLGWPQTVTDRTQNFTRKDEDGVEYDEVGPALVPCIVKLFKNREEAQAFVDSSGDSSSDATPSVSTEWAVISNDIYNALDDIFDVAGEISKKDIKKQARKYDVDVEKVEKIAAEVEEDNE